MEKKMSSLIKKIKKSLPYLVIILIILNLFFFVSNNEQNKFDEDRIVKILSENKDILPRILDKLEIIDISGLLSKVISCILSGGSISNLFKI